jgi:hypothetical protein
VPSSSIEYSSVNFKRYDLFAATLQTRGPQTERRDPSAQINSNKHIWHKVQLMNNTLL